MAQAEKEEIQPKKNPLIWVSFIVIGLIIYIFTATDRQTVSTEKKQPEVQPQPSQITEKADVQVNREPLAPPGVRARKFISDLRQQGKPYPFGNMMAKASEFASEGSLADAHLMFFFTAREGHIEAMMMMAEMSDPTLFRAENNLLDKADAVQALKWYRQALEQGFEPAQDRLDNLRQWAKAEADYGNVDARHLLLNFK